MARNATTYNSVLGTDSDHTIVVLEDIFSYGPDFRGATGAILRPVFPEEITEAKREKREYLRETADECNIHGQARTQLYAMPMAEYLDMRFEEYRDVPCADIAAKLGVEAPARYELVGCGRVFSGDILARITYVEGVEALVAKIEEAEAR